MLLRRLAMMSVLGLSAVIAGCGSTGASTSTPSAIAQIEFKSPAVTTGKVIPTHYVCDENEIWLPLQWGALPSNTVELALYVARFGPVVKTPTGASAAKLLAQSLVIGLKPSLRGLPAGKLPHGALIGFYGAGRKHSPICPPKGNKQSLLFRLYALSSAQHVNAGLQGVNLLGKLNQQALAAGSFTASYART
jgi:phosphatidylethanolamine-binding protein (PEBP) family uncharacterized protein